MVTFMDFFVFYYFLEPQNLVTISKVCLYLFLVFRVSWQSPDTTSSTKLPGSGHEQLSYIIPESLACEQAAGEDAKLKNCACAKQTNERSDQDGLAIGKWKDLPEYMESRDYFCDFSDCTVSSENEDE